MTAYQVLPDLSAEDFAALRADIAARGVLVPVEYDEDGNILDGHHRVRACEELGLTDWPRFIRKGLSEADKRVHARQLNLARRHLNRDQKRDLIAAQLRETPEKSNRQVAEGLGVDDKTVGTVRRDMEAGAEIPHHAVRVGKDGVTQPARKPIRTSFVDTLEARVAEEKAALRIDITKPHVAHNTGNNEWYTPDDILAAARDVMGGIWLDPASSEIANRRVGATIYFDKDDDGLRQSWTGGTIWMNPPYAPELVRQFADKLVETVESYPTIAIVLVNNATETRWFQRMAEVCRAICFPVGRVRFLDPDGNPGAPLQGQAILYFGFDPDRFCERFAGFGFVVRHG